MYRAPTTRSRRIQRVGPQSGQRNSHRTAVNAGKGTGYNFFGAEFPESRDRSFKLIPHPAYGSEFSTGGIRFVRA